MKILLLILIAFCLLAYTWKYRKPCIENVDDQEKPLEWVEKTTLAHQKEENENNICNTCIIEFWLWVLWFFSPRWLGKFIFFLTIFIITVVVMYEKYQDMKDE